MTTPRPSSVTSCAGWRGKENLIEIALTSDELRRRIEQWVAVYEATPHSALDGLSPAEKARRYTGTIRRVENPRALDVLLYAPPMSGRGDRTVSKSGVRLENATFIAGELATHGGERVNIRVDPEDLGRVYVFAADWTFICIAECPERTGISRPKVAAQAHAEMRKLDEEVRALRRRAKKNLITQHIDEAVMAAREAGLAKVSPLFGAQAQVEPYSAPALDAASQVLAELNREPAPYTDEDTALQQAAYQAAFECLEYDWGKDADGVAIKALEVEFPGGSRITALPANPDTARGYSRNVYLDEFAFHKDSREIWKAVFPIVSRGYKCWVTSTPNGKGNKFYDLATSSDGTWEIHRCDIYRAAGEGYPVDVEALRKGLRDEDAWSQEYELKWLDEASAWLSYDLISSCESDDAPGVFKGGQTFIGVDIGIRSDLWVAWVLERVGDVLWTREIRTLHREKFAVHDAVLDELVQTYKPLRIAMDQTGLGEKPVEDAQRRYGASRVEGVTFGAASKLDLAQAIKRRFESRTVRIPDGDTALRNDLTKVKKETGAGGAPRFTAERDSSGHADRFWALALAVSASTDARARIDCDVAPLRRAARPDDDVEDDRYIDASRGFGAVIAGDDCGGFL